MSYLSKSLASGETIVFKGRFHPMQHVYAWAILVCLGVFLIGIFIWIREMIRLNTTEFIVTNSRVVLKTGFFSVHVNELVLSAIEGGEVDQSLLGRMFGYGRLTMRGRGDTHLEFPTLDNPSGFRAAVEAARIAEESLRAPTPPKV